VSAVSELTMQQVIDELLERYPESCIVSSCGYPSRELFNVRDRPGNFYLVGSMGMAAPIALGVALARPAQPVIALDGDGSLLMNLGVLPMVAAEGARLVHVVLDNGMHESTGGQRTVQRADFPALARAAGYRAATSVRTPEELAAADLTALPALLHVPTAPRHGGIGRRVEHTPHEIVERVHGSLNPVHAA
jgi:phosphonopyruvate decarboxylase